MRKGLVQIILLYSLVLCLSYLVPVVFSELFEGNSKVDDIVGISIYFITVSLSFILLRIHLNKKYDKHITFWRYVIISIIASIISIILYQIGEVTYQEVNLFQNYSRSIQDFFKHLTASILNNLPFVLFISLPEALIVGFFYNRFKKKRFQLNESESLDSDLIENLEE